MWTAMSQHSLWSWEHWESDSSWYDCLWSWDCWRIIFKSLFFGILKIWTNWFVICPLLLKYCGLYGPQFLGICYWVLALGTRPGTGRWWFVRRRNFPIWPDPEQIAYRNQIPRPGNPSLVYASQPTNTDTLTWANIYTEIILT